MVREHQREEAELIVRHCLAGCALLLAATAHAELPFMVGSVRGEAAAYAAVAADCTESAPLRLHDHYHLALAGRWRCVRDDEARWYYIAYYGERRLLLPLDAVQPDALSMIGLDTLEPEQLAEAGEAARLLSRSLRETELKGAVADYVQTSEQGVAISSWQLLDAHDGNAVTGFGVSFLNSGQKVIRAVQFTVVTDAGGTVRHDFRSLGPIVPGQRGRYSFRRIWPAGLVHDARVSRLTLLFSDGRRRMLESPPHLGRKSEAILTDGL